jgi:hypothetical protein
MLDSHVKCPDCGGPRVDLGGKSLEYRHTDSCPKMAIIRSLFPVLQEIEKEVGV